MPQTKVLPVTLDAGANWSQTVDMPGADGTNKLTLEVSNVEPMNLGKRLDFLLGYPHGCIEQITSKGFPQLFLKQLVPMTQAQTTLAEEAVKDVIRRHRSYQTADGGMSYWPGSTSVNGWGSVYAAHFECEAEARGFNVPSAMKSSLIGSLGRTARAWKASTGYYGRSEELTQAYRLYVLALAGQSEMGAMNRMKEEKNLAPMSRWMLALAYAKVGRKDVAEALTERTVNFAIDGYYGEYDLTFGSQLRDRGVMLQALCALDKGSEAAVQAREISRSFASDSWLSTQESAYGLLAMSEYMTKYKSSGNMEFSYNCAGQKDKVSTDKNIWSKALIEKGPAQAAMEIRNNTSSTLFVRIIAEGVPEQGEEEAYANGINLSVSYLDMNGNPVDVTSLAQGVNFQAVVSVRNPSSTAYKNLALTQIFPSGWEILNTRFTSEEADKYPAGVNYQDIRDDRVYSYMDRMPAGRQVTIKINLCSVYKGSFYLPPVYCEAMYDHTVRANTEGRNVKVE